MENIALWWNSMDVLQKIYFCIGLAATVFLILQIITLLFGFGDDGSDISGDGADVDIDVDNGGEFGLEAADGFTLFTVRGVVSFFAIGGWTGYILAPINVVVAIIASVVAGVLALILMAYIMRSIMRLRSNGNIEIKKAVGMTASVYLTIPTRDNGFGKINLTLEERFIEVNAIQKGEEVIPTGSNVKVIGIEGENLIVEKI